MKTAVVGLMLLAFVALTFGGSRVYTYEWGRAIVWLANMFLFAVLAIIAALYDTRIPAQTSKGKR